MAKKETVWGIDIGNTSLKAIRCRRSSELGKIEAIGFDFIEHSKIMSQPGAEPGEILAETLKEFLNRNSLRGDRIAISVSGQNTISRFLKLPPVDVKKVSDIIRYEAKQWLPFDLQDVVWDYQTIGKGLVESGIILDSEIGMFAMKRDITMRTLAPYIAAGINIDCIQSSPIAAFNFVAFDQLGIETTESDGTPDQTIVLCVGTDATDVIITNGINIWTRSIPIGGNLFTKAMTKGLKLTFTKAEYLKRNASAAQDPKAVFQAMRPVFNDMLSEVHRSLEYYSSLNRRAKFSKVLALGNAFKMPGLRQFLAQNLGYEVVRPTAFTRLTGSEVVNAPVFKDNLGSFSVAYGLATQLLGKSVLKTNLIPKDLVLERLIRKKKPWVLAAAASVLLGLTVTYVGGVRALEGLELGDFKAAESKVAATDGVSKKLIKDTNDSIKGFQAVDAVGKNLTGSVEGRIIWLEFYRALNAAIPVDPNPLPEEGPLGPALSQMNTFFITKIETSHLEDAESWWSGIKSSGWYIPDARELGKEPSDPSEENTADSQEEENPGSDQGEKTTSSSAATAEIEDFSSEVESLPAPPSGGTIRLVTLTGYHYHNPEGEQHMYGANYVRETLCKSIKYGGVDLPVGMNRQLANLGGPVETEYVTFKEFGFMYPTVMKPEQPVKQVIDDPRLLRERQAQGEIEQTLQGAKSNRGGRSGMQGTRPRPGAAAPGIDDLKVEIAVYNFQVQFLWVETPPSERDKKKNLDPEEFTKPSSREMSPEITDSEKTGSSEETPSAEHASEVEPPVSSEETLAPSEESIIPEEPATSEEPTTADQSTDNETE